MATKKTSEEKEVKETVKKTASKKAKGKKVTKKAVTDMFKELNVSVDKKATCVREDDAVAYLVKNKFMATSDCTVDIEYKSPIYYSECPISKIVGGVEYMDKNPNYRFSVNNENCGIHTHFGFYDNHFNFTRLAIHYEELFKPLCDAVDSLTDSQRESIFGRSYEGYASKCRFNYPDRHENWINIQHRYTLEIRMPRFTSAVQYMRFLKTFKKIFKALNTFYINRGQNEQASIKAGRKMAKIFEKEYLTERVEHREVVDNEINLNNVALPLDVALSLNNLTNSLNYGIIASDRTYPNAVIGTVDGVAV